MIEGYDQRITGGSPGNSKENNSDSDSEDGAQSCGYQEFTQ